MCRDASEIDASHFRQDRGDAGTQKAFPILSYYNGLYFVPVTKVPCGPRETAISRDRWLVMVTIVVLCLLRICLISNGYLPVTFLGSFVTLDLSMPITKVNFSRSARPLRLRVVSLNT
jgi:hypothetical protein